MLPCVADDHSLSILTAHGLPWPGSQVGAGECQPHDGACSSLQGSTLTPFPSAALFPVNQLVHRGPKHTPAAIPNSGDYTKRFKC